MHTMRGKMWWVVIFLTTLGALGVWGQPIVSLIPLDIGLPTEPGTTTGDGKGNFTVIGGGADIWDASDQFQLGYQIINGDFDVRVRVESLDPINRWSKAGLMARESPASDSRMVFMRVTPTGPTQSPAVQPVGADDARFAYRTGLSGGGAGINDGQHEDGNGTPNYPSSWLRLRRIGSLFIGYSGADGVHWTEQGRQETGFWAAGPFSQGPGVGLAVTSHDDRPGFAAKAEFREFSYTPQLPVQIVTPPHDTTVHQGESAKFKVAVTGYDPYSYQWYRNGISIPGATGDTLNTGPEFASDDGAKFSVLAGNSFSSAISLPAVLHVTTAVTPLTILRVSGDASLDQIHVKFSQPVSEITGYDPANYVITAGGLAILSIKPGRDPNQVTLLTAPQAEGALYELTVDGVSDLVGTLIAPQTKRTFHAFQFTPGVVQRELYLNIPGAQLSDLGILGQFPGQPDADNFVPTFETPPNSFDNYAVRLSGFFTPPVNGVYIFYLNSNGEGVLYLSANESPANKLVIATEPAGNPPRNWTGTLNRPAKENISQPVSLNAGKRYYLEAVMKAGVGGDNLAVTYAFPGNAPQPGDPPIPAAALGAYADPDLTTGFFITGQPQSQLVPPGANASLSVTVSSLTPVSYQWRRNGVNLPGENGPTLNFPNAQPASSGNYSVVVTGSSSKVVSDLARLDFVLPNLPLSDNFSDRSVTSAASGSVAGNNSGFTRELGEPLHAGKPGGKSAWLAWRPLASGIVTFTTAGSEFDTLLAVYLGGTVGKLNLVTANDDAKPDHTSSVSFNVTANVEYEIAVDGFRGGEGAVVLSWDFTPTADFLPVINNLTPNSSVKPGAGLLLTADDFIPTPGAVVEYQWFLNGQPVPGATGKTLSRAAMLAEHVGRYTLRIRSTLTLTREILSAPIDVQLNSAGDPDVLALDKFADVFNAPPAQPLQLAGWGLAGRLRRASGAPARGYTGTQIFSNFGGSFDPGETNLCGVLPEASEWFPYEAPASGTLTIDTDGSTFDTVLGVFTATAPDYASLQFVACDRNSGPNGKTSKVTFTATMGTTYYVAIDTEDGTTGLVYVNYNLVTAPVITVPPTPQTVVAGTPAAFSVTATSSGPLNYQWRSNSVPITGANASTYSLLSAQPAHAANYSVVVTNVAGTATSADAALTVNVPPAITTAPTNQTATLGSDVFLTVVATGTGPLSYQWQRGVSTLAGATNPTYSLLNVKLADAGTYSVVVSNLAGSAPSSNVTVSVIEPPTVTTPPVAQTVVVGANVTFTVLAAGSPTLTYRWLFNGAPITGATGTSYLLSNAQITNAGSFSVVIANSVGTNTAVAGLTVLPDTPPQLSNLGLSLLGSLQFHLTGTDGRLYVIEGSTNFQAWTPLWTNAATGGGFDFLDADSTNHPARFYRARSRP